MPEAIDQPDEGEAGTEEGAPACAPPPANAAKVPELKLPKGVSHGDDGSTLIGDEGDEGFGELTEEP